MILCIILLVINDNFGIVTGFHCNNRSICIIVLIEYPHIFPRNDQACIVVIARKNPATVLKAILIVI